MASEPGPRPIASLEPRDQLCSAPSIPLPQNRIKFALPAFPAPALPLPAPPTALPCAACAPAIPLPPRLKWWWKGAGAAAGKSDAFQCRIQRLPHYLHSFSFFKLTIGKEVLQGRSIQTCHSWLRLLRLRRWRRRYHHCWSRLYYCWRDLRWRRRWRGRWRDDRVDHGLKVGPRGQLTLLVGRLWERSRRRRSRCRRRRPCRRRWRRWGLQDNGRR